MQQYKYQTAQLAVLMEEAIQIAWDFLERTGEIEDPEECSRVLLFATESMMRQGIRSRLLLSNKAVDQYKRHKKERDVVAA